MFDLSYAQIALLSCTALVAGCARGFSGFGGALIFVPIASSVVEPRLAVPLLLIVDLALTPFLLPKAWRHADRGDVGWMVAGAIIGIPFGTWLLTHLDGVTIRWAIVGMVVMLLALLMSGWRFRGPPSGGITVAVGLASGLLSGAAQVGGPPVVAYWLGGTATPLTVRANIVLYFAVSSLLSVGAYLVAGLITWESTQLSLLIGPTFALGLFTGARLFNRVSEPIFRRICYGLIAAAALLGLPVLDGFFR